jgi:AraC family transcriptional regulator of adaptative response / DNA-3-methyladenine glycosylase II
MTVAAIPEGLDPLACHRAVDARDPEADGRFFVAIRTTRIYCRPVCASRRANRENRRFYATRVDAERDGYRPCLRCKPELPHGAAGRDPLTHLAQQAAGRIADGFLDGRGVAALAHALDVSDRHLRRAIRKAFGCSPIALAQSQRLGRAHRLLTATDLPVIHVAYASGFRSLRRFNALVRSRYHESPTALRRRQVAAGP